MEDKNFKREGNCSIFEDLIIITIIILGQQKLNKLRSQLNSMKINFANIIQVSNTDLFCNYKFITGSYIYIN